MLKLEINPRWLGFVSKHFLYYFWSFYCCFLLIQFKNILVKISWLLVRKLTNMSKMTWFCAQNFQHSFFCQFVVVWYKRGLRKFQVKFWWLFQAQKPPRLTKLKNKPRWLGFELETYPHSYRSIFYRFPLIQLKKVMIKISWWLAQKPVEVGNQSKMTICN